MTSTCRRRVRDGLMGLALVALAATGAEAQYFGQNKVQYDKFDFKALQTPHFDIYYYSSEADAAADVARMSERWYSRLSRLMTHELNGRQTIVLYASHPEFEQTNVVEGLIDEGTGGVTEGLRRRVVLPLAGSLGETDHVLGHELIHAFQYDILGPRVEGAPLWFIEGMAEYLSIGPRYAQTAIWLRDAALEDHLPKVQDLDNPRYFPYRFGHAFWAYIGGRWGDQTVGAILHGLATGGASQGPQAGPDPISIIESATGLKRDVLSSEWHDAIRAAYNVEAAGKNDPIPEGVVVIGERAGGGTLNVGPSISPDGSQIAFLSEQGRLSIELYVADAATGKVRRALTKNAVDPHFQSLQFLASAGTWDPTSTRLAVATVRRGRPVLAIFDVNRGSVIEEIPLNERGEIFQPSWSPDGNRIAFSAQLGGFTDLVVYDLGSKAFTRLTRDAFADMQPIWSPDGRELVFITDRFSSNLETLSFSRFGLAAVASTGGDIRQIEVALDGNVTSPQWAPDGGDLFVISDANGRPDLYRVSMNTGRAERTMDVLTGITGITHLSPALSVARTTNRAAVTVFRNSGYEIQLFDPRRAASSGDADARRDLALLPPTTRTESAVARALGAPREGLPPEQGFPAVDYSNKFSLVSVGQQVGVGTATGFGTYVSGGISFLFSDLLGNHLLATSVDVNGAAKDAAAQVSYINRSSRWNWGVFGEHVPLLSGTVHAGFVNQNGRILYSEDTRIDRQTYDQAGFLVAYPFSRASRLEFNTSVQHIGFSREVRSDFFDPNTGQLLGSDTTSLGSFPGLKLGSVGAALVRDTGAFGAVGPVLGQRLRLEVAPTFGDLKMVNLTADLRQYAMPVRPVTFAARVLHVGRYGSGGEDSRLSPLFLGYSTLVRGYDPNSFQSGECTPTADGSCREFDNLLGSRVLVTNGEIRMPVGGFTGKLNYGPVPTELFGFFDAGVAWTRDDRPAFLDGTRSWVASAGVGARVNVFGYFVAELNLARPIDRPGRGWLFVFNMRPGF